MSHTDELLSELDALLHCPLVLHQLGNGIFSGPIVDAFAFSDPINHSLTLYLSLGWKQTLKNGRTWVLAKNGARQCLVSIPLTDTSVVRLDSNRWLIMIDEEKEFAAILAPSEHFEPVGEEQLDIPA